MGRGWFINMLHTCPSANIRFPNDGEKSFRLAEAGVASQSSFIDPNVPAFRTMDSFRILSGGGTS